MGFYDTIEDEAECLQHHGIRGQKWGIRRFQRPDGTRTAAGRAREREDYREESTPTNTSSGHAQNGGHKVNIDKKKVATGLAIAGTVALGAALIANPGTRNVITKYGKTAVSGIKDFATSDKVKEVGKKAGQKTKERLAKTGDAMVDAALMSVGGIAVTKLAQKLTPSEEASEVQKMGSKIAIDTASAGIRTMTGGVNKSNYGNGGNKGSGATVDKNSKEYQSLFNGLNDDAARKKIKSMANDGASMEELQKYRDSIGHSDLNEWIHASEFGSFIV